MNRSKQLKKSLQSIERNTFITVAKRIAKENNFSDFDLNNKFSRLRKDYPIYDELCRLIQAQGVPIREETLLHAIGMETMLRTLISIAEDIQIN